MIDLDPPLDVYGRELAQWLDSRHDELARFRTPPAQPYEQRANQIRELQRVLFDAGWARCGWPVEHGGLGGSVLHRAAMIDLLARRGYPPRYLLEHLEILPPALIRYAQAEILERLLLPTLRGDLVWCQGFSEPSAGSDLAALKTRAERRGGDFEISGHKIWTSWAPLADWCLVLARTGSPEDRHRGISAFVVALDSPGLEVQAIRQANGTDELAEVFFDDVRVPESQLVGEVHGGWAVAMEILAGERGSYGWLRHTHLLERLERLAGMPGAGAHERALGEVLVHLLALRCRSREVMEILAAGEKPGPESSVSKVLVIDADQRLYEVAREILSPDLDLGTLPEAWEWQESYLYSRASGIYGGTRQIQLNVIAKLMVRSGGAARNHGADVELDVVRQSVADAAEQSPSPRAALDGLGWWDFAARPVDALGRAAFAAWFEEQGRRLSVGPALAGVAASAVADALNAAPGEVAFARAAAPLDGDVLQAQALGWDAHTSWLVIDATDGKLLAIPSAEVRASAGTALDAALVTPVEIRLEVAIEPKVDAALHSRATALARLGAAYEILGAATALTDLVVDYTGQRQQFGQPLSGFQAVQHMLSECQVDLASIASIADAGLDEWPGGESHAAAMAAKALAGRAGRRVAQRSLQCFGAISFTDEHPHHRYLRRIHTLDAVLGTMYGLEAELGADLVRTGRAPRCIEAWHRN